MLKKFKKLLNKQNKEDLIKIILNIVKTCPEVNKKVGEIYDR